MRYFVLLFILLFCFLAYVRIEQPDTWNSWLTAAETTNSVAAPASPGGATAPSDNSAAFSSPANAPAPPTPPPPPPPPPVRSVPVGGLIQEGDFSSGGQNWQGDGVANPEGKGLDVKLDPYNWTKVYQTFPGNQGTLYSIEVTYRFSPGLTVSQNPSDYTNISNRLQLSGFEGYSSIGVAPGDFYGTIGDPSSNRITCEVYTPKYGTTDVQDYQHTYATIPPNGNNTFALAFPPGTGTVTLLTVYVTNR